jgi:hypothetical protein
MRLRDSFWALLGHDISDTREFVVERIRSGMLKALDAHCHDSQYERLDARISGARDVSELWYLRPDLMHAISACRDEAAAREALDKVTLLFKGHHPSATPSRFGSL